MTAQFQRPHGPHGGFYGINNLIAFQRDTLGFLAETAQKYGDISYFRMAAFHFYLLNNPDYVYETVVAQGNKIEKWKRQTDTWANSVGASTLTLEGDTWKQHRRILNPSFHSQTIKRYYDIVVRHTERLLDRWQDGMPVEMMYEMMRTTMGIIAEIIFSVKDIEHQAADLNRALTAVFEVLTARTTAFQQIPLWLPTRDNRRIAQATRVIEAFMFEMIRQRRAQGQNGEDILNDLMSARDAETGMTFSDRQIVNELKTLFGAGHETTALWMMWTLHLLSQHPGIQEKLYTEVRQVLGERQPGLQDFDAMPYTLKVLNESMRVFPPAWSMMVRRVKEEIQLGDHRLPPGSVILIPMWVIHHDERIFPDPLKFDPERFDGDWKKRYPKYAYFPFGGGPHICVGNHLAMFEGQIILPMLVQHFRYEPVPQPKIKLQALLTLRPKGGLLIKTIRRE
jgi:cytochrome P450